MAMDETKEIAKNWARQQKVDKALRVAATNGSAKDVEFWLEKGANPAAVDRENGGDALFCAVRHADASVARRLLPMCDPTRVNAISGTPLMIAASWGSVACVELLLPVSDANARDAKGNDALMAAAGAADELAGLVPCIRLLAAHCDPNAQNNAGETALMRAAWRRAPNAVRELARLSDAAVECDDGSLAIDFAMEVRSVECVLALKNAVDPATRNKNGLSLAERARAFGDEARYQEFGVMDALSDWMPAETQKAWIERHGAEKLPTTAARVEAMELAEAMAMAREGPSSDQKEAETKFGGDAAPQSMERRSPRSL